MFLEACLFNIHEIWKHGNTEKLIFIRVQIYSGNKKELKGFFPFKDDKKISYFYF